MKKNEPIRKSGEHGTFASYTIGFALSIFLTLAAYCVVQANITSGYHLASYDVLVACILTLAMVQLCVQLFFFLHLGKESGPRWKAGMFVATIVLVLIIVVGSIWIMNHLNYNMSPQQVQQYLIDQSG
jgi:cytochrome o ubiquinol oxidase subunit IV